MKQSVYILIGAILAFQAPAFAAESQVKVTVKGMVCGFCAQGIKKKFGSDDAVKGVDVNLTSHLVTLDLKDGKILSDEKIQTALKESGYTVESIKRN